MTTKIKWILNAAQNKTCKFLQILKDVRKENQPPDENVAFGKILGNLIDTWLNSAQNCVSLPYSTIGLYLGLITLS